MNSHTCKLTGSFSLADASLFSASSMNSAESGPSTMKTWYMIPVISNSVYGRERRRHIDVYRLHTLKAATSCTSSGLGPSSLKPCSLGKRMSLVLSSESSIKHWGWGAFIRASCEPIDAAGKGCSRQQAKTVHREGSAMSVGSPHSAGGSCSP